MPLDPEMPETGGYCRQTCPFLTINLLTHHTPEEHRLDRRARRSSGHAGRSAVAVPLTIAGCAAAAAGTYLDILAAASFFAQPDQAKAVPSRRLVVLVPAHNEADLIGRCLESLNAQSYPVHQFKTVVIADNCSDRTAAIAASLGAEVLVRTQPDNAGKGQALRWAMDQVLLGPEPPDAIVIVDADSLADPGLLTGLAWQLESGASVVQGEYLALVEDDSPASTLRAAGLLLFHRVRFSGRAVLGLPCNLVGNGMLLSRRVLEEIPWSAFTSAEDLEYSVDLRLAGVRPVYAGAARLQAPLPARGRPASVQRLRWEGGRFHVVRTRLPKLLREIFVMRRWSLADAAVDLAVPPLGVLAVVAGAGTAVSVALVLGGGPLWLALPWIAASVSVPVFVLGGLAAVGAPAATYRSLALAPWYVTSSLFTRLRLLRGLGETTWERTERPGDLRPAEPEVRYSNKGNGRSST